jgi:hypothetical protein
MFGKRDPTQHGTITLYEINKKNKQLWRVKVIFGCKRIG